MKKKLRINRFIIIAVLIYFIYTLFSQQQTLNSYKQEASTYSNQIEEANEKNDELKNVKSTQQNILKTWQEKNLVCIYQTKEFI